MLHGAGGTASWTLDETELDKFADEKGIVLLLPEGTREDMNRPRIPAKPPSLE